MKIGVVFPQLEIEPDAAAIKTYAQAVEALRFDHILAYDHVLGADINDSDRSGWPGPYTHESSFHEPLTLFSYLAGITENLEFGSALLIAPQRQTALIAKQAACLDLFCNGRFRLGVGSGWNPVEYEALGVPMTARGARLDEQIDFMRRLWTESSFSYEGRFHTLDRAGINPLPVQRPIPVWIGGVSAPARRRAATVGDGWLPVLAADKAQDAVAEFREMVVAAGRNPALVGIDNIIFLGDTLGGPRRSPDEAASDCAKWRSAGASHVTFHTMGAGLGGCDGHLAFLRKIRELIG